MRSFASDNTAPAAQEILAAIAQANKGDAVSYGDDDWTGRAQARIREVFGGNADVFFTFNGTGANVVALSTLVRPFEAVLTPATSHLQTDECGAFERFTGCKVLTIPAENGKLSLESLRPFAGKLRDEHHVVPRVLSISQSTEYGTLYAPEELREICEFAHAAGWYVHLDGARIANAAAAQSEDLRACTRDLGVDVLTFGGTKNGLLYGEAIVFFDPALHGGAAKFMRKQGMQLASKMRFIAAQFLALIEDDRWLRFATHANEMTKRLESRVREAGGVQITRPVQCNAIFARLPRAAIEELQREYFFYVFDEMTGEVRWMTHHATTAGDVDGFASAIARITNASRG